MLEVGPAARDILLRGVRLRYAVLGGEAEGTPILALHGLGRSLGQWSPLARALEGRRRVIALDFPGFGESERPPTPRWNPSYESLAESALDLIAALDLRRVILLGHSIGAAAAVVAAADRPECVEKLVLVAPPCYARPTPIADRLLAMPVLGPALFRRMLGRFALDHHDAATNDATFAFLRRMSDPSTLEARLPRLRTPTLVVWGRNDRVIPAAHGSRLARAIDARLEVLECGHDPAGERPEPFAELVVRFVEGDEDARRGVVRTPRPDHRRPLPPPSRVLPAQPSTPRAPRRDR